jgi:hypothetical protein
MNPNLAFLVLSFALAIAGLAQVNNQQAQQSLMNAAISLLVVRSGLLRRWSNFQTHNTSLASGHQRRSIGSRTINQTIC